MIPLKGNADRTSDMASGQYMEDSFRRARSEKSKAKENGSRRSAPLTVCCFFKVKE